MRISLKVRLPMTNDKVVRVQRTLGSAFEGNLVQFDNGHSGERMCTVTSPQLENEDASIAQWTDAMRSAFEDVKKVLRVSGGLSLSRMIQDEVIVE